MESELELELEEDVVTRFADGFRPVRVRTRFLELHMGRPVRGCAYGQPMSTNSPRTYLSEAVVAASGPGGGEGGREGESGGGGGRGSAGQVLHPGG